MSRRFPCAGTDRGPTKSRSDMSRRFPCVGVEHRGPTKSRSVISRRFPSVGPDKGPTKSRAVMSRRFPCAGTEGNWPTSGAVTSRFSCVGTDRGPTKSRAVMSRRLCSDDALGFAGQTASPDRERSSCLLLRFLSETESSSRSPCRKDVGDSSKTAPWGLVSDVGHGEGFELTIKLDL